MLDKSDREYLELLKKHLARAEQDLQYLKDKVDLKIIEINAMEEMIETLERKDHV